jgi:hypothetical protein
MASPQAGFTVEQPSAMELWRAARGERVTYSEIAWIGASTALVAHASLHFFSAAIYGLERFLVLFGPPESLAFAVTDGANPIATWFVLLALIGVWGVLIGVALLTFVHEITNAARRLAHR